MRNVYEMATGCALMRRECEFIVLFLCGMFKASLLLRCFGRLNSQSDEYYL